MEVEDVLAKAAEDIATYGHHKGGLYKDPLIRRTSPACALGAIERAGSSRVRSAAIARLWAVVGKGVQDGDTTHYPWACIPEWNDHPATTAEDVILMMKKAARGG